MLFVLLSVVPHAVCACIWLQMASVPGHPIWRRLMDWFKRKTALNIQDPLKHTGPMAITAVIKVRLCMSMKGMQRKLVYFLGIRR